MMQATQAVRLPSSLIAELKKESEAAMRSVPKHIEYMIQLARAARDNPDLPIDFIAGCLEAKRNVDAGNVVPFEFRKE